MLVTGDKLRSDTRAHVLRAYVHRWTHENSRGGCVACRDSRMEHGKHAPLVSDAEWLAAHAFHVRADGKLDGRFKRCEPHYMATN